MRRILVDSGILLSYYQRKEPRHPAVVAFFDQTSAQLITSPSWPPPCQCQAPDPLPPRPAVLCERCGKVMTILARMVGPSHHRLC